MVYRIRRVELNNLCEIVNERKRCETIVTPCQYRIGALVSLRPGKLYRVEEVIEEYS